MKKKLRSLKAWLEPRMNRIKLPGMQGLGLYSVLRFFVQGLREQDLQMGGMAMAFRFFLALFPGLMIIFTFVSVLPISNLREQLMGIITSVVPSEAGAGLIRQIAEGSGSGVGLFSINLLLLLVSAVGAIKVMINAFYRNDEALVRKTFLKFNLAAFGIFFLLFAVVVCTVILMMLGDKLVVDAWEMQGAWAGVLLRIFHALILLVAIMVSVSVLYHFGPEMQSRFAFISPGSVMAALLILGASWAFRLFVRYFFNFELYAGLSAIMLIMIWFYWVSFVILTGFELNRAIARLKRMQHHSKEEKSSRREKWGDKLKN